MAGLEGNYFVVPTMSAITGARKLSDGKAKDFYRLRRQGLKLMWWPSKDGAIGSDIDWDWIKALKGKRVGELRVDEEINGNNNSYNFL